jgi:hypothetical protein
MSTSRTAAPLSGIASSRGAYTRNLSHVGVIAGVEGDVVAAIEARRQSAVRQKEALEQ